MDISFAVVGGGIEKEMKLDGKTDISIYSRQAGGIYTAIVPGEKLSSLMSMRRGQLRGINGPMMM